MKPRISKANAPGVLATATEKSKEFATKTLPQATVQGAKWVAANPGKVALGAGAGVGIVLVAAPGAVAGPLLGAVGFGADGIVAASTAASVQSGIGSVVAPSIFSTLQSAAAGGYGVATVYPVIQVMGGAIASPVIAGFAWAKTKAKSQEH